MIDFGDADILGYSYQNNLIGENFRFGAKKNLSIQGNLLALDNSSGVRPIVNKLIAFQNSGQTDYDDVILRGVNFGLGQIQSIRFDEGNDVKVKRYTVDLLIYETGNLFNATGSNYQGINLNQALYPPHLIDDFGETFSFNKSNDGIYSYTHNLNVKYTTGAAYYLNTNPLNMSKQLSAHLINSNPVFGFLDPFWAISGKRTYAETQNLITNQYSVTENFRTIAPSGSRHYSNLFNHSLSVNENGTATITENGTVQCLLSGGFGDYKTAFYSGALVGVNIEVNNSRGRCQAIFSNYVTGNDSYPLNTGNYLTLNRTLNKFGDTAEYSVTYTNDPKISGNYSWDYTTEINKINDKCYYEINERGRIRGMTACNGITAGQNSYQIANTTYNNIIKPGISGRLSQSFSTFIGAATLYSMESSVTKGLTDGYVEYSHKFTNDPEFSNSNPLISKLTTTISDTYPTPYINKFNIFNNGQIVQPQNKETVGGRELSINILGKRNTTISNYRSAALSIINSNIPTDGTDVFITDCSYSLNPFSNEFNLNVKWNFVN